MSKATCDVCETEYNRANGETYISEGKQWLFCSDSCRNEWRDNA